MKVALTGASGNMGERVLKELLELDFIDEIKVLGHHKKSTKSIIKANKKHKDKISIIMGSLADIDVCRSLVKDTDYVLNLGAVIPPLSDKNPEAAIEANEIGVKTLIKAIEEIDVNQPKLIHTSTVGLYGDRCEKHLFGRVGDPLLISPFDIYALTKMRGEYAVLESNIKCFTIIRQSAMLYDKMLFKNISDGLMFHTCYNSPLEWSTARDSGVLYRNILIKDHNNELDETNFWKKCFNLGAKKENRITGFETLDEGFKIIGGSTFDFFEPNYNSLRNFHGMWFSDSDELDELFHYKNETVSGFWKHVLDTHKYFKLAKLCPKKLIKHFVIDRLLKDDNAPRYWYKNNDKARMIAYFGPNNEYENIDKSWDNIDLICKRDDYEKLKETYNEIDHYFDDSKDNKDITIEDLRRVAEAHGGKLISEEYHNDVFEKLEWETQDKERFIARPNTILRCGHWYNVSYKEHAWDFDRLAKSDKIYASIWYDAHSKDENYYYYFDENYNARIK
ncbi:MAG: NAD(P)-dependent oxidoreductase [Gammaproteobacteria bacterium]|nr:NAD(P)-dependent oxidoreductase [Gammaproteobacteria bacterium]